MTLVSLLPLKQLVRSSVGGALPAWRKEHPCLQGGRMLRGTWMNWCCWPPCSPSSSRLAHILLSDDTFPDHPLFIYPSIPFLRSLFPSEGSVSLKTYNKSVLYTFILWICFLLQRSNWQPKQGTGIFFSFSTCAFCFGKLELSLYLKWAILCIQWFTSLWKEIEFPIISREKKNHGHLSLLTVNVVFVGGIEL